MNTGLKNLEIDLSKHGAPVFTGRPNGLAVRTLYNLDEIDVNENITVTIIIPADTYTINSSFFLGLLGDSVRKAGSKEAFQSKFKFTNQNDWFDEIEQGINRALLERNVLLMKKK